MMTDNVISKRKNFLKDWRLWAVVVLVCCVLLLMFFSLGKYKVAFVNSDQGNGTIFYRLIAEFDPAQNPNPRISPSGTVTQQNPYVKDYSDAYDPLAPFAGNNNIATFPNNSGTNTTSFYVVNETFSTLTWFTDRNGDRIRLDSIDALIQARVSWVATGTTDGRPLDNGVLQIELWDVTSAATSGWGKVGDFAPGGVVASTPVAAAFTEPAPTAGIIEPADNPHKNEVHYMATFDSTKVSTDPGHKRTYQIRTRLYSQDPMYENQPMRIKITVDGKQVSGPYGQ